MLKTAKTSTVDHSFNINNILIIQKKKITHSYALKSVIQMKLRVKSNMLLVPATKYFLFNVEQSVKNGVLETLPLHHIFADVYGIEVVFSDSSISKIGLSSTPTYKQPFILKAYHS